MNIILFPKASGRALSLQLNRWYHFLLPAALVLFLISAFVITGFYFGIRHGHEPIIAEWEQTLSQQQKQLTNTREMTEAHMHALTQRIGQLQAHVNRLDALGNKLVQMANLDRREFDFTHTLAIGGPETNSENKLDSLVASAQIEKAIDDVAKTLENRESQLRVLDHLIMSRNLKREVHPQGRPVDSGWTSSYYGMRTDPVSGRAEFHRGVDFAGKFAADVKAVAGGMITWTGNRFGYGNMVEIDHGNGYITRYGHNSKVIVSVGEAVKKGQKIAQMGSSGRSTGPHVHFEVLKNGRHVDPAKFIQASH